MKVRIEPSVPSGTVTAPPSKSVLHRLIIASALSCGKSVIENAALSEDIFATLRCVKALGASYTFRNGRITVQGIDPAGSKPAGIMDCGACGSTLRFMLPVCMLCEGNTVFTGTQRLLSRPLSVYENICSDQNIMFLNDGTTVTVGGGLRSGRFEIPGNISSQFVSGLLFALPLLNGDSEIVLTDGIESRPYIDMTVQALGNYNVHVDRKSENVISVPGNQKYQPCSTAAEGDWSNAAFLLAAGGKENAVHILGLNNESTQGDKKCVSYFRSLADGYSEIDISDQPDLGPVLFVYAAMHHGGRFTGTSRLRIKESDRCAAIAEELEKAGCNMTVGCNEVLVPKAKLHAPAAPFRGHDDHRIVMSLALLCTAYGGCIEGAEAVNKSFPTFFETLEALKVKISYEDR